MQRPPVQRARPVSRAYFWPRVSVVIPTLNEARNIASVLDELPRSVFEVILVDGRSTDGTVEAALAARPDCRVVMQTGKGKGDALTTGFAAVTGDIVVTIDGDGSADPAEIPIFVGALLAGADFTKGSRHLVGGGSADLTRLRSLGNRGLSTIVNVLFRTRFTDLCYGYNAFWRDCLPGLALDCSGFEIETLMNIRAVKAGFRVAEVPSFERPRLHGLSNLNAASDGVRVLKTIVRERRAGWKAPAVRARVHRAENVFERGYIVEEINRSSA
jgi:glycosyltransferase involved in cell wall biosynthesis